MENIELSRSGTPSIIIARSDYDRLCDLADIADGQSSAAGSFLLRELDRAEIVERENLPVTVVALYRHVEYRDDQTGHSRKVALVCPGEQDADAGLISVLTPIGAALLGLSEGQSIAWTAPNGARRSLTVVRVDGDLGLAGEVATDAA